MSENTMNNVAAETIVTTDAPKTGFMTKFSTNHPVLADCGKAAGIGAFSMLGMYAAAKLIDGVGTLIENGKKRRAAKKAAKAKVVTEVKEEVVEENA